MARFEMPTVASAPSAPPATIGKNQGSEISTAPVDHQELTVERLPRIGRRYELTGHDQQRVSVVIDARGNRHISIHAPGDPNTAVGDVAVLNEAQRNGTFDRNEEVHHGTVQGR